MKYTKFLILFLIMGCNLEPQNSSESPKERKTSESKTQAVEIQVVFDSILSKSPAYVVPALKYGKNAVFNMEWDDNTGAAITGWKILNGFQYSDGSGLYHKYTATLGVNGYSLVNEEVAKIPGRVNYGQCRELIDAGWDIANHSNRHADLDHPEIKIASYAKDLKKLNRLYYSELGYLMNCFIVPTNYFGFVPVVRDLGFLASSSTGAMESIVHYPEFITYGSIPPKYGEEPFIQLRRDFTDSWLAQDQERILSKFSKMMVKSSDSTPQFYRLGSHTIDSLSFQYMVSSMQNLAGDRVWFTSTREWMEYRLIKDLVQIKEEVKDSIYLVKLSYKGVPEHIRWRDLSLMVKADLPIKTIRVTGDADSATYNLKSGLINVYLERRSFENEHLQ